MNLLYQQAYACIYPPGDQASMGVRMTLCRSYVSQLQSLASKSRARLSPVMRRSICRGCRIILDARITCRMRLHKKGIVSLCAGCGTRTLLPLSGKTYAPCYFEKVLPDSKLPQTHVEEIVPSGSELPQCHSEQD